MGQFTAWVDSQRQNVYNLNHLLLISFAICRLGNPFVRKRCVLEYLAQSTDRFHLPGTRSKIFNLSDRGWNLQV